MALPVLLSVDDDGDALAHVEAQLLQRYGMEYRVESLGDAEEALRRLTDLARAGEEVALVLVGLQISDAGTGGELLERARELHPDAKRALLVPPDVAWAEPPTAQAILDAMAVGRIDYYVGRPAASRDEVFHEAIAGFLLEWATDRRIVPHTVHIVGEEWSGRAYELRDVFQRCAAPHSFCLADSSKGRELLAKAGPKSSLPLMVLPDGTVLSDPSDNEIALAAGAPPDLDERTFDLVIVGAGPAGVRGRLRRLRGTSDPCGRRGRYRGQARSSSRIRNYLGFPKGLSGARLAEQAHEQASVFGASFFFMHRATALEREGSHLNVSLSDGRRLTAEVILLATGASYRRLGVPSLEALNGAGVFYGGTASEAQGLTAKDVYVVGGGNSAGQAALHLARYAREVTMVVRAQSLAAGMSHYLVREIEATSNVRVRTGTTVVGGGGDGRLEELVLREGADGQAATVAADALFVLIGARHIPTGCRAR